jgi:hypothetical protein
MVLVVLVACGSRGDVEPVVHAVMTWVEGSRSLPTLRRVRVVTHDDHATLVTGMAVQYNAKDLVDFVPLTAAPALVWQLRCVWIQSMGKHSFQWRSRGVLVAFSGKRLLRQHLLPPTARKYCLVVRAQV